MGQPRRLVGEYRLAARHASLSCPEGSFTNVTEVMVNGPDDVYVERGGRYCLTRDLSARARAVADWLEEQAAIRAPAPPAAALDEYKRRLDHNSNTLIAAARTGDTRLGGIYDLDEPIVIDGVAWEPPKPKAG
jgi:Flp pilus assembly CpaF family ATPase